MQNGKASWGFSNSSDFNKKIFFLPKTKLEKLSSIAFVARKLTIKY